MGPELSPDTKILILDIDSGEPLSDTIENIFIRYSHLASRAVPFGGIVIKFDNDVRITDWTGWTQLYAIYKEENTKNTKWYKVSVEDKIIEVTNHLVIPEYNPVERKHGFHGEVLYPFNPLRASDLSKDGYLRVRNIDKDDGLVKQFSPYTIDVTDSKKYGYSFITKSNFFNANDFHLCTRGILTEDKKSYYK